MTTRWENLAGDTGVFALKLAFASDPDAGRGIDPETGASWGSFQIWVEGRNLCAHREEGERIDSVHWYLLPLLEWFARNWDPLLHEERLPAQNAGDTAWESLRATRFPPPAIEDDERAASAWEGAWRGWWSRHALQAAREGGPFPDVVFRRLRDRIELSWGFVRAAGTPGHYQFTESEQRGFAALPPQSVARPLHDVLSQAARYLSSSMPESKRIEALNRKVRELNATGKAGSEASERRLAWLAGLGTTGRGVRAGWRRAVDNLHGLAAQTRQAMLETVETPLVVSGSCHAALMFGSLAPDVTKEDVQEIAGAMVGLHDPRNEFGEAHAICRAAPVQGAGSRPWDQGYDLAEEVHGYFDGAFEKDDYVHIENLIGALRIDVATLRLSDEKVRGVSIAGPHHRPGIFINERHARNADEAGRRFTLAHELCHLLFDREKGQPLAAASGPWAPGAIEKRANAFAAMLLMPTSLVKRTVAELADPPTAIEGVYEAAKRLRAGRRAVLYHLMNLGFIDEADRRRLETEIQPPFSAQAGPGDSEESNRALT